MGVARFPEMLVHLCKVAWCQNTESLLIVALKNCLWILGKYWSWLAPICKIGLWPEVQVLKNYMA